jgi:hypothetical protein
MMAPSRPARKGKVVRSASAAAAGFFLMVLIGGCGQASPPPLVEAEGIIRLDGVPLNNAQVRFVPVGNFGPEYIATGVTDKAGRFRLTCNGRPGACACECRVLVMEADIPARLQGENAQHELAAYMRGLGGRPIPPKYTDLTASPLTAHVSADQKEYNFDLVR